MKKSDFNIIDGGLTAPLTHMQKQFSSAYVTNTRLMGVLAVYACWEISLLGGGEPTGENCASGGASDSSGGGMPICSGSPTQLHQFFYIDCEEAGLETFKSFRGEFGHDARLAEQALVGGLGAKKIPLSEMELRWLLLHWKKFNEKHSLPLPPGYNEYSFLFDQEFVLKKSDADAIILKTFVEIDSDYQAVNYFLMRCFGRDYEAARYLTGTGGSGAGRAAPLDDDFPLDIYDSYVKATFCKNVIDFEREYGDGSISYICDSLIEMQGSYDTVISRVVVKDCKIIGFEHCDSFPISSSEAAMMLKKTEFVNVHEVMLDDSRLEENIGEFIVGLKTVMTKHSNGRLFMAFKSTNDHVKERVFMLSNDVWGTYYLTDFGQLIVMAYSTEDLNRMEMKLATSPLGGYLIPTARYEFIEPVLFEFINSGFEDFEDFLGIGEE